MSTLFPKHLLNPKYQRLSYRCAFVLYSLILIMGSIPGARDDLGQYASGVVLHSLAYAALAFLLFVGNRGDKHDRAIKSVLTVMAMGAFDEFVQGFSPFRTASISDWIVDAVAGTLTAGMLWANCSTLTGSETGSRQ